MRQLHLPIAPNNPNLKKRQLQPPKKANPTLQPTVPGPTPVPIIAKTHKTAIKNKKQVHNR